MPHATSRIALFCLMALSGHAFAQQAICPPATPSFDIRTPEPVLNRSLGFSQLNSKSREAPTSGGHAVYSTVAGLYEPVLSYKSNFGLMSMRGRNSAAVCINSVNLNVTHSSTIFMAREIPLGGCADSDVWAHEYTHHRIQLDAQRQAIETYFSRNPLPTIPFTAPTEDEAVAAAHRYMEVYGQMFIQSVRNFVIPRQQAFDSPAEYERSSRLCAHELGPLIRAHRVSR